MTTLGDTLKACGVVGAGGAGITAYVKAVAGADKGLLINKAVITQPRPELLREMI